MATATKTPKSDEVALATTEDSKPTKLKAGGRPAGYTPLLPFSTTKTVKGIAENAFKEFKALGERCNSGSTTSEELVDLLVKQSDACLEIRKTASLMWLSQGLLLHTLKEKVKSDGGQWMTFFDANVSGPLKLSERSEQLQRKMYTDWLQSMSALPAATARALEECEQVNDLAGKLKKLSAGQDPWQDAPPAETATMVDETSKRRQKWMNQLDAMAIAMVKDEVPSFIIEAVNTALEGLQTTTVDAGRVEATETIEVVVEDFCDPLADAIGEQLESIAA